MNVARRNTEATIGPHWMTGEDRPKRKRQRDVVWMSVLASPGIVCG